jgi:predicted negative regulator of RcsB-dependent stress response
VRPKPRAARSASSTSLGNAEFSEAEKKAARAAALEMIKTAVAKMGQGDLTGAEKELMQAKERDAAEPLIYYNLAIVRLRQKQPEEALKQLEAAFMAGFSHFDAHGSGSDLDPLRNNPKFKELMRTYHKDS